MRKTKIVCTVGPACLKEDILKQMCLAGMNVARLNFAHGTHEDHLKAIELIKKVRDELSMPIAILLDTKGPEYRIGIFEDGKVFLSEGDRFTFTTDDIVGDERSVSVNYKGLPEEM
jgi:pyruvate kinase